MYTDTHYMYSIMDIMLLLPDVAPTGPAPNHPRGTQVCPSAA